MFNVLGKEKHIYIDNGGYTMKLNKENFLKTELGSEMKSCIIAWDKALDGCCNLNEYHTKEYKRSRKTADLCQSQ